MAKLATVVLVLIATVLTRFAPVPEELKASFDVAQKFYASGAYKQALDAYTKIIKMESRFMDESKVTVSVGDIEVPVKEAAIYQSGNCYFKLLIETMDRAENAPANERRRLEEEAERYFELSRSCFSEIESKASVLKLRVLAQKRLIDLLYYYGRYGDVVEQARRLMEKYPESGYVTDALYNMGWAYFKMEDYERSISAFEELARRFPGDYRADRALFQIGECRYSQGSYEQALEYYLSIVKKYRIDRMTEQEIRRMEREKLGGLVDETALELAGKAQLRAGDCYANLGEVERAAEVYKKAADVFGRYRWVVEQAYIRLARAYLEDGKIEKAADVYRDAIDRAKDKVFKARMQALVAKLYYDAGKYEEALREYGLYIRAYGEVAERTDLSIAEAEYKMGRALFEMGKYEEAISHYMRILEEWPESNMVVAAKFNIALCKQTMGKLREALDGFSSIVQEHPEDDYVPSCLLQMARINYELKDYQSSLDLYRKLISSYPEFQRNAVHFELGLVLKNMGRTRKAVEECLKVEPGAELYPRAVIEAGQMLLSLREFGMAREVVRRAMSKLEGEWRVKARYILAKALAGMEDYEGAARAFDEVAREAKDEKLRESAIYGRGVAHFSLGRYKEAEEDFSLLLESQDAKIRYSSRKLLGMALIRQGKEMEAIGHIDKLISMTSDPYTKAEYMLLLAELLYGARRYGRMIEICNDILSMNLEDKRTELPYYLNEKAYFLLGEGYSRLGKYEMACRTYEEGLRRYPEGYYSGDMLFGLAFSHFQCGRMYEAAVLFDRFLSEHPDDPNSPYAKYYLGYSLFSQSVFDRSAEVFSDLGLGYPDLEVASDALFRAGESYFNLGKFELAVDFYRKVLEDHPNSPQADDALYSMAWALLEMGKEEEAVACFRKLLSMFPESEFCPHARFSLGDYYYNLGEYGKALREYKKVLEDYPQDEVASKVPEILEDLREVVAYQDYEKAIKVFREAMAEKDPEKFEEAASLLKEVADRHPGTESAVGALSNMGICYEYLRRWKEAVSVYDKVIAMYDQGDASPEAYRFAKAHRDWIVANRL